MEVPVIVNDALSKTRLLSGRGQATAKHTTPVISGRQKGMPPMNVEQATHTTFALAEGSPHLVDVLSVCLERTVTRIAQLQRKTNA